MPLSQDRSNRLSYRGAPRSRFSYPWSRRATWTRWVRGKGFSVVTVLLVLALTAFGELALAIPAGFGFVVRPPSIPRGAPDNRFPLLNTRSGQLSAGKTPNRLLAEAPVFRPDDGRVPRERVESGRFRPDPRAESPSAPRERPERDVERRGTNGWSDRQQGRFRPLPEKRRRYEELYPTPAPFPLPAPEWRP